MTSEIQKTKKPKVSSPSQSSEIARTREELEKRLCKMCKSKKFIIDKRFGRKIYCDNCIIERRNISQTIKPITKEQRKAEYFRNKKTYLNRDRNKEIYSIRQRTAYLERIGKIKKSEECIFCLSKDDLIKHHPNYAEPNRIVTLCRPCHNKLHNKKIKENVVNKSVIKEYYEKGKKEGVELAQKEFLDFLKKFTKEDYYDGAEEKHCRQCGEILLNKIEELKQSIGGKE
jgi:hypothetical protein